MPWYHEYANHGPGHQSRSDNYFHTEEPLSDEAKHNHWDDWAERKSIDNAKGYLVEVTALPQSEIQHMKRSYQSQLAEARRMLDILDTTPTTAP